VYNISNRGFLYVTPQVRLASSGELKEMSDIKISLKHPVRSVMELCLKLSTQNAVLPVLLALMIHSKDSEGEEQDSNEYKLLEVVVVTDFHAVSCYYDKEVDIFIKE